MLSAISLKCAIYCPALSEERCHENLNKQINNLEELCVYSVHDWVANISLKQTLTHKVDSKHKKHNSRGGSGGGGPEPHRLAAPPPTARRPSPGHPAALPGSGGHGRKNFTPQDKNSPQDTVSCHCTSSSPKKQRKKVSVAKQVRTPCVTIGL